MKYAIYASTKPVLFLCCIALTLAACSKKEDEKAESDDQAESTKAAENSENTESPKNETATESGEEKQNTEQNSETTASATKKNPPVTPPPKPRRTLKLEDLTPQTLDGMMVRVFRRSLTTAVITVFQERLTDEESAIEREANLIARGWKPWPPRAAPELAGEIAKIDPAAKDCPFLLRTKAVPVHGLERPIYNISCLKTVQLMEDALETQERIDMIYEQARPCGQLLGIPPADYKLRHKALRQQCLRFGIKFNPYGKIDG